MTAHSVGQAAENGSTELHLDHFDAEDQDWYIMQWALDRGMDPYETVQTVRSRQAANARIQQRGSAYQGDSGEVVPLAPVAEATGDTLAWPPGRAGRIAQFIYGRSYSPVREVAIVSTLALMAGVCGRAYRTYTRKDLAMCLILIARSGIGKDSTHEAIPYMLKLTEVHFAERFVRARDFASGEALHKEILREPGFLALQSEFGRKLKRMSNPSDTPMQSFRTVMTNAFGKEYLEGKSYSNSDNSLDGVDWPALSFLGETTPSTFLERLTTDMMADGFLSRFLSITYEGHRPPPNRNRGGPLPDEDLQVWRSLVTQMTAFQLPINTPSPCTVRPTEDAKEKLERFELSCIAELNATEDESERQVWSRAHLKAMKVASLLAVADNPFNPVMELQHVAWALSIVRRDITAFRSRMNSGDVGTDDTARERKLVAIMRDYLVKPVPASYKVPSGMLENGIITRSYLQIRTTTLPAFSNHKLGSAKALDEALRSMMASGYIMEVDKLKQVESYGYHGKSYRILELPGRK